MKRNSLQYDDLASASVDEVEHLSRGIHTAFPRLKGQEPAANQIRAGKQRVIDDRVPGRPRTLPHHARPVGHSVNHAKNATLLVFRVDPIAPTRFGRDTQRRLDFDMTGFSQLGF